MERERERKREKHNVREKHPMLPPVHTPARDRTHNLLVYGTTLQPTEPPSQGLARILISTFIYKLALVDHRPFEARDPVHPGTSEAHIQFGIK